MKTEKEWQFVKNLTKEHKRSKTRWFIGLKIVDELHEWCWLKESMACVKLKSFGTWRWNDGEPNHLETEKCVEMLKNGEYNNIKCSERNDKEDPGYICEKQVSKFMIVPKLC